MRTVLDDLDVFVKEANDSNSSKDKMVVIGNHPECLDLLKYTYDVMNYQYGVTSKNIKKVQATGKLEFNNTKKNIFELLEALNARKITGHEAISEILSYISQNPEHEDLILNIIDRNLKTRTDIKLINKVFPNSIPVFDVALANSYDDVKDNIDFEKQEWLASRKLDGCRCTIINRGGEIKAFSRSGKEFLTLQLVIDEVAKYLPPGYVLDGEICIVDEHGADQFQEIMKYIRKKNFTIPNPRYVIFDCIKLEDFDRLQSDETLSQRLGQLQVFLSAHDSHILKKLDHYRILSVEDLEERQKFAADCGWEGLIIRLNTTYKGKRSNDLLKVKYFMDAEFTIQDAIMGPFRYIAYTDTKKAYEVEEEMLSAVAIEYKGNVVKVGSGFSLEQRKHFYKNPSELIGRQITVKYFENTTNQEGGESLRFPTVKVLHDAGGRDT